MAVNLESLGFSFSSIFVYTTYSLASAIMANRSIYVCKLFQYPKIQLENKIQINSWFFGFPDVDPLLWIIDGKFEATKKGIAQQAVEGQTVGCLQLG